MTLSLEIENITKFKADLAANLNRINILGNLVMNELKLKTNARRRLQVFVRNTGT